MEQQNTVNDEIEIDLKEIVRVLLSKLWFILFLGVILGLILLIYSKYVVDPIYSSTTKVYVLSRQSDANVTYSDLQTGSQLTKDYVELVKSRTVLTQVLTDLELDMSTDELASMIDVNTTEETRIITIVVNNTDVYLAQKIANDVREVASAHICQVMNLEAVNTVDEANIPTRPSSPNVKRNTFMGFGLGIFMGIAIVLVIYLMDDSIRTPDDVERYLNVSVLASIPILEDESKRKKKRHRQASAQWTEKKEEIPKMEDEA
ncbi:MAG: protein-tyrosine kinase [Lachnospiraceae bacterium]|nr:protein-tyrosine kinase [Lachnospiraceae bacterium]